ncbi:carbohydrate ABC transporter permease [Gemmiger formicilis]|uniref:carbohydrate ABC transporter permease n=1 Tax=Gemmiger formicilis TaxID=745368 RepID=UPI001FAEE8AD|nr:sugar ABC transporter permease [Gemmiger formicilis]
MSKDQTAISAVSKKGMRLHYRKLATPYLMLAPMLAFVLVFMIWPIINVFIMSVEEYKITKPNDRHFIGLENFIQIFTKDDLFWRTLGNTLVYAVISVVFQCVLGFWLAYLLTRKFKGRGIVRALALVPWAVAGLMVGIIWNLMLGQTYGVINDLLQRVGLIDTNISWFSSASMAMLAACIANVWRGIPFFTISFMSALVSIPDDLYESARIDGANAPTMMFRITIPMIKDTIIFTTLLRCIWTFNAVDLIIALTDGGPNRGTTTLALYTMRTFTNSYDYGYASALAVVSTIIMLVVAFVYIKFGKMGKNV